MNLKKIAIALSMCLGLGAVSVASATEISESDWTFSPGVSQSDSRWLRLTGTNQNKFTSSIQSKKTYSRDQILKIEFDYVSWGGSHSGGDGLALYLFDPTVPNAGTGGKPGGGLGYCGLTGAYVGIGVDEVGSFSSTWCDNGRIEHRGTPNGVSIRGSQSRNYAFWGHLPYSRPLDCEGAKCTTRDQAIKAVGVQHVVVDLIPKKSGPGYAINLWINGNEILAAADYPYAAPASLKIGLSAATGDYTNVHEIRDLQVHAVNAVDGDACSTTEVDPGGTSAQGVPAYLATQHALFAYPILNDGDRTHKNFDGLGKWGAFPYASYSLDFSGAPCKDRDGACAAPGGKGAVEINTVTVYARQDEGSEQEPTDATRFTQSGPVDFRLDILEEGAGGYISLPYIRGNNLVKRTFTFPTKKVRSLYVIVDKAASQEKASIVEIEVAKR